MEERQGPGQEPRWVSNLRKFPRVQKRKESQKSVFRRRESWTGKGNGPRQGLVGREAWGVRV